MFDFDNLTVLSEIHTIEALRKGLTCSKCSINIIRGLVRGLGEGTERMRCEKLRAGYAREFLNPLQQGTKNTAF